MDTLPITCEHGGNREPAPYPPLFSGHRGLLDSHRGFDPRALSVATGLAEALRHRFDESHHLGIELEVNQGILSAAGARWTALRCALIDSLRAAAAQSPRHPTDTGEQ